MLAARLSESGTIASVLGTDLVPPVVAFGTGYENGAKYANADINVITTYHPGGLDVAFTDPEWGAATAAQAIDQGADVIFGAGGTLATALQKWPAASPPIARSTASASTPTSGTPSPRRSRVSSPAP
ncbi:MAG: BMP family ABC transporter substrate-binding protein [Caldilineaceae bacterium]